MEDGTGARKHKRPALRKEFSTSSKSDAPKGKLVGYEAYQWSKARPKWGDKTQEEWDEMTNRMFTVPERNFAFWDWNEPEVIEEYMNRFCQEDRFIGPDPVFHENWANAKTAYHYAMHHLHRKYTICVDDMGIKEAIRKGEVVENFGSFLDSPETIAELQGLNKKLKKHLESSEEGPMYNLDGFLGITS